MICPNCNTETNGPYQRIIKREGKHYITYSCFKCSTVLMEKETRFGLGTRIIFWIIAIPLSMLIFVLAMSVFPRQVGEYIIVSILIVAMLIILIFVVKQRKMENANNESINNIVFAQNENGNALKSNENFRSNDPLMSKIVENLKNSISEKTISKKKRYFLVIIIIVLIIFNEYPVILEVKNLLIEKKIIQTNSVNSLRGLRGEQLAEELDMYYDLFYIYPPDLHDEVIINNQNMLKELRGEYEKDELGKEIKLSDFTYKSTKHEFELCLNDGEYSKCWRGKDGKRY